MRHTPSLATFAAATTLALSALTSSGTVLASDGGSDQVNLATVGLDVDVPVGTGRWIVTPSRRRDVRADAILHEASDGTRTRMAVALGAGSCDEVLHVSVERGARLVAMQWPNMPGMYARGLLTASHVLTVCMDTNSGSLTVTTGAINNTAHETAARIHTAVNEHGHFIGAVYLAAREAFGMAGVDPVRVSPSLQSAPAASAAPSSAPPHYAAPAGYMLVPAPGYIAVSGPGYYVGANGYAPGSQQMLYSIPSAYLPNTQSHVAAIHQRPEPTTPFGFGAGMSLGVGFHAGSRGAPGARAVIVLGGRAPSAFEFGVRTVLEYGWDSLGETGEIGAATYVAIHPLAIAHHHRFDPSLYVAAGYSGIAGMGRNVRLPFVGAVTRTAGLALDVRVRRGFHVGAYAEFETVVPTITSGIWANDGGSFYRASAGIRIMGWGMR
jgi:hypothetical protein